MTLKDWLTLAISGAALALGLYNHFRTRKLERRTELKPYFSHSFRSIRAELNACFSAWHSNVIETERKADAGVDGKDEIILIGLKNKVPELDEHIRAYDSGFVRAVKDYRDSLRELRHRVHEYNDLIDPFTVSFEIFYGLRAAEVAQFLTAESGEPADPTFAEMRSESEQRLGKAKQLLRRFLPDRDIDSESLRLLRQNKTFREQLLYQCDILMNAARDVKRGQEALERRCVVYDKLFEEDS